jgi:hypothetical protein
MDFGVFRGRAVRVEDLLRARGVQKPQEKLHDPRDRSGICRDR